MSSIDPGLRIPGVSIVILDTAAQIAALLIFALAWMKLPGETRPN